MLWLILPGAAALFLALLFYCYWKAFHSPDKKQNDIFNMLPGEQYKAFSKYTGTLLRSFAARPFERVYVTSHDGLRLSGRYYHHHDGAPLTLGFHGYRGTSVRDFCGSILPSMELGHNVLLVDQRAHCESEGHTITFGVKERFDCLTWLDYVNKRFGTDTPVVLQGGSMGAATVLMAAELPLPENVCAIVADCPYNRPEDIIRQVCQANMHLPHKLVYPLVDLAARIFGGFRLSDGDAVAAVKHAKVPIFLVHGEEDRLVPCEMSEEIRLANPALVQRHTFPGAAHGISYLLDTPRYEALLLDFLRQQVSNWQDKAH